MGRGGPPVDPVGVLAVFAAAAEEALADGYRGLRVSADVTGLVRTAGQQDAVACYELLLDRYAAQHPLSALCMYCSAVGGALTQLGCRHAAVPAGLAPFQVDACADGAVALSGEVDAACLAGSEKALEQTWPVPGGVCSICRPAGFMGHRALSLSARLRESARSQSSSGRRRWPAGLRAQRDRGTFSQA